MNLPGGIWSTRDASDLVSDTEDSEHSLQRSISSVGLTAMGVGAIIGTGIFVVIGEGAKAAGPAVILAFVLAAVTCLFSALSYAELAAAVPVSGSAYTYSYATMGELVAFIIGWDLILEYGVSVAAVAVGWGGNVNAFLDSAFGVRIPDAISTSPEDGGVFNLPAVFIVMAITFLLIRGTRESAKANLIMVGIKIAILVFFIVAALTVVRPDNFKDFAPHGAGGITTAAGLIFFAYIGFDAVATGSEESNNPGKDLPKAIVGSLVISPCSTSWSPIAAVGVAPISTMTDSKNADAPLSAALEAGTGLSWAAALLSLGALIAITSVVLVILYGQTRIFFAMCRDGLLPRQLRQDPPALRHARAADAVLRHPDLDPGGARAALGDRQAGQHRHAVRVRAGQHRRDHPAAHQAGHGAAVPHPVRPGVPDHRRAALPLPDDRPAGHHLDPVRGLAGRRPADLRVLQLRPLPAAHA